MSDAVDRLVSAYHRIECERMQGMPLLNTALAVEAVGFRPHGRCLCGVLITPWFMNLILLPASGDRWTTACFGSTVTWQFNTGEYDFAPVEIEGVGTHLSMSLFSTLQDFPDQEAARRVAEEVLEQLLVNSHESISSGRPARTPEPAGFRRPVSRRRLLHGWISAGQDQ